MRGLNMNGNADHRDDRFTYVAVCACPSGSIWQAVTNGNPHDRTTELEVSEIVSCRKAEWTYNIRAAETEHKMEEDDDCYRIEFANGKFFILPGYWMIPVLK